MFEYAPRDRLRDLAKPRRLASLVCFLRQSYRDTVDQAVDMFDKLLTRTCTQAEHDLDDQIRTQRHSIKAALERLRSFGVIILDDSIKKQRTAGQDLRGGSARRTDATGARLGGLGDRQDE